MDADDALDAGESGCGERVMLVLQKVQALAQ
jgi:hypothetical protein